MEIYEEFDYDQYEWIYYFFDGFDVTSFNNNLNIKSGNNKLNNQQTQLNLRTKNKKNLDKNVNEININNNENNSKIKQKKNIEINIKNNNKINTNNNLLLNSNSSFNSIPRNNGEISFAPITSNQFSSKESPLDRSIKRSENNSLKQSLENSSYKYSNTISEEDKNNIFNNNDIKNNKNEMVRNIGNYLYGNNKNDKDDNRYFNNNEDENKLSQEDMEFAKNFVSKLFEKKNNIFEYNPSSIGNNNVNDNFDNKEDEEFVKDFVSGLFEKKNNECINTFSINENNKDKNNINNIENKNYDQEINKKNIQNNKPKTLSITTKNTNEDNINETKYSIPTENNPMFLNNTDENIPVNNQENISSKNNIIDKNDNLYNKDSKINLFDNYKTFGNNNNNELQTPNEYSEKNVSEYNNKKNNNSRVNIIKIAQKENNKENNNNTINNDIKSSIQIISKDEDNEINDLDKEFPEDEEEINYPQNTKKLIVNQKQKDNKTKNNNNYNNEITEPEFNHIDSHSTQKNEIDDFNTINSNLIPNIKPDDKLSSIENYLNNKEKDDFPTSQNKYISPLNNKEKSNKQITGIINKKEIDNNLNNKNEIKYEMKSNKIKNQINDDNKYDNEKFKQQNINKAYNKKIINNLKTEKDNKKTLTLSFEKEQEFLKKNIDNKKIDNINNYYNNNINNDIYEIINNSNKTKNEYNIKPFENNKNKKVKEKEFNSKIDNINPNKNGKKIINKIEIPQSHSEDIKNLYINKNFQSKQNEFNNNPMIYENEYNKINPLSQDKSVNINFGPNRINDNNNRNSNIRNIHKNNIDDKENRMNNNSNLIINSNNLLIPEKDNNNIIDSQPFDFKLNEYNSVNKKPENNNIDLKIPLMDYNIISNTIIDFNLPYKTENNINNKVDFSEFDNTQYDSKLNKQLFKKNKLFPTNNISPKSYKYSKIKENIKNSNNKLIPKSYSNRNFTKDHSKSNKNPYKINKYLFQSIKNSKPELIKDEKTPESYFNQNNKYSDIKEELRYSSPEKELFSDKKKQLFLLNNFNYSKNKNRKNNLSMNYSKPNELQLQRNDSNLNFIISELNNNFNISNNNNLINIIPGINIVQFNENRKKNKEKLMNEINLIKSPKIENPTPYQNSNEGNEKIMKEIEELNQEILNMKKNENKNDFKDRLKVIKSEGFDKILSPINRSNHSNNLKQNKNMKISKSNIDLKVQNNFDDYQIYNDYNNDYNSLDLAKKLSPLGLIYPDKPRNNNNIIKRLKMKKGLKNKMDDSSYNNSRSLLRNRKIINYIYKDDNDIIKLRNIRLSTFKPNIDDDIINDVNNLKRIGSNIIFPINEIPFDMKSPFNKLYIKVPEDNENRNNQEKLLQIDILNDEVNVQNENEDNQIQEK